MAPLRSCEFMSEVPNVSSLHSLGRCIVSICFYVIVYVFSYWLADFGKLAIRHFWGIMSCGRNNFHKCAHFIVGMIISTLHFYFFSNEGGKIWVAPVADQMGAVQLVFTILQFLCKYFPDLEWLSIIYE